MGKKTMAELLQEEKEKLVAEVNEKVKKRKTFIVSPEPETGFQNLSK